MAYKLQFKRPLIIGIIFGVIGSVIVFYGYGVYIEYLWLVYFAGIIFVGLPTIFQKSLIQYFLNIFLVLLLPTISYFCSSKIHVFQKSLICEEVNVLIDQVNNYHQKNGYYPSSLSALNFSTKLAIRAEPFEGNFVNYNNLNDYDVIVYMGQDGFICIVPVTKLLPISMTRMYRFIWTLQEKKWKYDVSIWTLEVRGSN
jgi:hypothetical protein